MLLETFSATFEIGLQSNRSTILRKKKKGTDSEQNIKHAKHIDI
jgi:hypothetical protein